MDWNGDGVIGGFDEDGHVSLSGDYSADGKIEIAHTDPIYLALFTSWVDDWLLGGDMDRAISGEEPDRQIGGWSWDSSLDDGNGNPDKNEMVNSSDNGLSYGDADWGIYNEWGQKEVGSGDDRTISDELDKLVHNVGVEYWYSTYFALRAGYYYDKTGKIENPTFGVGLRFGGYGFDFGYTSGDPGHPLTNTMRFSLNMIF
jgi:hypothetical protein